MSQIKAGMAYRIVMDHGKTSKRPSGAKSNRIDRPPAASNQIDRPAASEFPLPDYGTPTEPPPVNILGCFAIALQQAELIREQLRSLVISENRHGDLMVARTATRRLEAALSSLIEAEENS